MAAPSSLADSVACPIHVTDLEHVYFRDKVFELSKHDAWFMGKRALDKGFAKNMMDWLPGPDTDEWFQREPYQHSGWAHELKNAMLGNVMWRPSELFAHTMMALRAVRDGIDETTRMWFDYRITPFHITVLGADRKLILAQVMYDVDRLGDMEHRFAFCAYIAVMDARVMMKRARRETPDGRCSLFDGAPLDFFGIRRGEATQSDKRFDENAGRQKRAIRRYYQIGTATTDTTRHTNNGGGASQKRSDEDVYNDDKAEALPPPKRQQTVAAVSV